MQQLKFLIIFPLILLALVYGGIKAYIYFGVKGKLDDAAAQAQPFAEIRYDGISSTLDGSIAVDNIAVKTPEQSIPVRIGTMELRGPGLGFLLDLAGGFEGRELPAMIQLSMRRMAVPDMQQLVPSMLPAKRGLMDAPPDPCDLGPLVRDAGMMSTDTYPIYLDMNIGYEMDPNSGSSRLEFAYSVDGGESLMAEVELKGMPQPGAVAMGNVPTLDRIAVQYYPNSIFLQTRVGECAGRRGKPIPDFIQGLLAQPDWKLAKELGFLPGQGLRGAIGRFLQQPQEVVLIAGPIENPQLLGSGQLSPQQMVQQLNLLVSVNGEPVNDLSFTDAEDVPAPQRGMSGMAMGAQPDRAQPKPRYIETPLSEAVRYIGRRARLKVAGRAKLVEGFLISVDEKQVAVERSVRRGKMAVHVELKDLQRIEIMRLP